MLDLRERTRSEGFERAAAETDGAAFDRAWEVLTWWRSLHARPLSGVAANLRYHVDQADGRVASRIEVTQRLKRLSTLIDKLEREEGRVTQMHDVGGVRALLPSQRHVYAVGRRLRKSWKIMRVRDYIAEPKESGYRALHLIVKRKGYAIEVQLRTISQDAWANAVEEQGRRLGEGLKFGAGSEQVRAMFLAMADTLARFDRGELGEENLREALKTMR